MRGSIRSLTVALFAVACCATLGGRSASGQTEAFQPYVGVVAEDQVYIRSGNSDGHYPIGKAKRGEMVKVVAEKYEWVQIQTVGPVFARFHGLVKYPERLANRLRVAQDGSSARTMGRVDVIAPNPRAKPGESWKMIARLEADESFRILRTGRTERGETIHEIELPAAARVWMKKQYVRPASAEETVRFSRILAGEDPDAATEAELVAQTPGEPNPASVPPATNQVLARDTTPAPTVTGPTVNPPLANTPAETPVREEVVMQPGPEANAAPARANARSTPRTKSTAERKLESLESTYALLQEQPIESAEIAPLRQLYLDLADEFPDHEVITRYARARSEQLDIWMELQARRAEMDKIKSRLRLTSSEAEAVREAMEAGREYVAVGRLSASIIYDGVKLPRLLRMQDPGTGRTVAYIQPAEEDFELGSMLGQLIGVVGSSAYDGGLRLTLITPDRIDLLAPQP